VQNKRCDELGSNGKPKESKPAMSHHPVPRIQYSTPDPQSVSQGIHRYSREKIEEARVRKNKVCPLRGYLQIIFPPPHLLFVKCEGSKQDIPKPLLTSWFGLRFAFASLCSKTKEEKQI